MLMNYFLAVEQSLLFHRYIVYDSTHNVCVLLVPGARQGAGRLVG